MEPFKKKIFALENPINHCEIRGVYRIYFNLNSTDRPSPCYSDEIIRKSIIRVSCLDPMM